MAKKQKRWNACLGGTNVAPPLGTEWEDRWPSWLSESFVNVHLLQQDPIDLRSDLFGGLRDPRNQWGLVNNLLYAIEREATKILNEDERRYIAGLTENQFEDFYLWQTSNTPKQANAIGALRAIEVIRSLTNVFDNHGYPMCDPHAAHTYESLTVAKIIMEVTTLIMAAIRGELHEEVWLHADENAHRERRLRETAPKANAARKTIYELIRQYCRDNWERFSKKGAIAVHDLHTEITAELRKPPSLRVSALNKCPENQRPPKIPTIRRYVKDQRKKI